MDVLATGESGGRGEKTAPGLFSAPLPLAALPFLFRLPNLGAPGTSDGLRGDSIPSPSTLIVGKKDEMEAEAAKGDGSSVAAVVAAPEEQEDQTEHSGRPLAAAVAARGFVEVDVEGAGREGANQPAAGVAMPLREGVGKGLGGRFGMLSFSSFSTSFPPPTPSSFLASSSTCFLLSC